MIEFVKGDRSIYKDSYSGLKILTTVKENTVESEFYYLEEVDREKTSIKTRVLGDVSTYFDLLIKFEGYKEYNKVRDLPLFEGPVILN